MSIQLNHITLAVSDVESSFRFYKDVMGFRPLCKWNKGAYFLVGELWFCLNLDSNEIKRPDYTHIAFSVPAEEYEQMKLNILKSGAKQFQENKSEGDSLYFEDPDGHKLEVHVGSWQTRISAKKQDTGTWQNVEFYI